MTKNSFDEEVTFNFLPFKINLEFLIFAKFFGREKSIK
jgi:hypothetical protein